MATTNEAAARGLFVALSELPKEGRGTRKRGLRANVPSNAIEFAARYLDASNALTMIESWMGEDYPNPHGVGRPQSIPTRTYIVVALACALAGVPITYAQIHHVITGDLPRASRATLGLPTDDDRKADDRIEAARHKISYYALTRLAAKVAATFDPKVYPSKRGLTLQEILRIDAERDESTMARKQARSDALCSALLLPAWRMLPEDVQAKWSGDITLDATVIPVYGKHGQKGRRALTSHSPEANAWWHVKAQKNRDGSWKSAKKDKERTFGYDAHLALTTGEGVGSDFPALLLGVSIDAPSFAPGHNSVAALGGIVRAGLPAGRLVVDRGYSQGDQDNFHLPVRALGYDVVQMYRSPELGKQAEYGGAIMVDGTWYGPCMPQRLIDASADHEAKRISDAVFESLIEARRAYALRHKSTSADGMTFVMRCPAQGKGHKVGCVARPQSLKLPKGATPLTLIVENPPQELGSVCTNAESITIPFDVDARHWQSLPYKSPAWDAVYAGPRSQIEGKNRFIKNGSDAAIADPDQRRFRGMGKQVFAILTKIVAANVQTLLAFIDRQEREEKEPPPTRTRRKPKPGAEEELPLPHAPPLRVAGRRERMNIEAA